MSKKYFVLKSPDQQELESDKCEQKSISDIRETAVDEQVWLDTHSDPFWESYCIRNPWREDFTEMLVKDEVFEEFFQQWLRIHPQNEDFANMEWRAVQRFLSIQKRKVENGVFSYVQFSKLLKSVQQDVCCYTQACPKKTWLLALLASTKPSLCKEIFQRAH